MSPNQSKPGSGENEFCVACDVISFLVEKCFWLLSDELRKSPVLSQGHCQKANKIELQLYTLYRYHSKLWRLVDSISSSSPKWGFFLATAKVYFSDCSRTLQYFSIFHFYGKFLKIIPYPLWLPQISFQGFLLYWRSLFLSNCNDIS